MRLQSTQAGCGPAAMSNALAASGTARTQAECEALCKTTGTEGTSPRNLVAALAAVDGLDVCPLHETREDVAMLRLRAALVKGRPVILCVDESEHWVAAVGVLGDRFLIADSADNELVVSLAPVELAAWWRHDALRKPFYGVIL